VSRRGRGKEGKRGEDQGYRQPDRSVVNASLEKGRTKEANKKRGGGKKRRGRGEVRISLHAAISFTMNNRKGGRGIPRDEIMGEGGGGKRKKKNMSNSFNTRKNLTRLPEEGERKRGERGTAFFSIFIFLEKEEEPRARRKGEGGKERGRGKKGFQTLIFHFTFAGKRGGITTVRIE